MNDILDVENYFSEPANRQRLRKRNNVGGSLIIGLLFGFVGVFAVYVIQNRRTPASLLFEPGCTKEYAKALDHVYQDRLQLERRQYVWIGFWIRIAILAYILTVSAPNWLVPLLRGMAA